MAELEEIYTRYMAGEINCWGFIAELSAWIQWYKEIPGKPLRFDQYVAHAMLLLMAKDCG